MSKPNQKKIRIGALISGSGTNLQAIIDACEGGQIDGQVVFVGSDNPEAQGLERADKHKVPKFVVDYNKINKNYKSNKKGLHLPVDFNEVLVRSKMRLFTDKFVHPTKLADFIRTRAIAEAALLENMSQYPFDLLVLAGFMRNLTPYFIDRVNTDPKLPRIMNIHPALLPAFPGTDGYGDTFRYGCKVGGCTVHFIDYGEDTGPIIGQTAFPIRPYDTVKSIKETGLQLEYHLYVKCIQLFAENRLQVVDGEPHPKTGKIKKIVKILD